MNNKHNRQTTPKGKARARRRRHHFVKKLRAQNDPTTHQYNNRLQRDRPEKAVDPFE